MRKLMGLVAAVAFVWASAAIACEKDCSKSKKAKTVATKTSPCGSKATTVSTDDSPCGSKAKTVATKKTPCGSEVKTVATGSPCGSKEATVSNKPCCGDCDKPCSEKCGKSATTVADRPCGSGKSATLAGAKSGCAKSQAAAQLASMPKMMYRVGDMRTCCKESATAKAKETGKPMYYVVEGEIYSDYGEAAESLTKALHAKAEEMGQVSYVAGDKSVHCPMTAAKLAKDSGTEMKYRVAGVDFETMEAAQAAAKRAEEAASRLHMTYKADGEKVPCHKSAKAAGKKVTYVVGDEETCCEKTARLKMAQLMVRTMAEEVAEAAEQTGA